MLMKTKLRVREYSCD